MRRNATSRKTLHRECGTCGKTFTTTADTPFMRNIRKDGKYKNTYYCCQSCYKKSYKYDMWANQVEKRREKDRKYYEAHKEEKAEKNRQYYQANKERIKAYQRTYREENYEQCLQAVRYNHLKRKGA